MENIINKKQIYLAAFFILFVQNTRSFAECIANSAKVINNEIGADTAIFSRSKTSGVKVLSFDDNNTINVSDRKLKLIVKEETADSYTLAVELKNKTILTKKHIKGISKVWLDGNYLAFSIFTYSDEDGNNEGSGYVVNLSNGSFVTLSKKLKNTCNPLVLNDCIYFVDGLSLIRTDMDSSILKTISLAYLNRHKPGYSYVDDYNICEISNNQSKLMVYFSPNKSNEKCQPYSGIINNTSNFVVIKGN